MENWLVTLLVVLGVIAVATAAVAVVLVTKLVRSYRTLRAVGLNSGDRFAFWGAIAYTIWPVDLLPDPIYLDDIGVLLAALTRLGMSARDARRKREVDPGRERSVTAPRGD
ncbi:YkvA family protein [Streptomyces alkaliphilus]|uniref:YkvA family protein n=1 Tax=Streptomyces alkaliphilus TaxID=1472722 RepID=UPI0034D2C70C